MFVEQNIRATITMITKCDIVWQYFIHSSYSNRRWTLLLVGIESVLAETIMHQTTSGLTALLEPAVKATIIHVEQGFQEGRNKLGQKGWLNTVWVLGDPYNDLSINSSLVKGLASWCPPSSARAGKESCVKYHVTACCLQRALNQMIDVTTPAKQPSHGCVHRSHYAFQKFLKN